MFCAASKDDLCLEGNRDGPYYGRKIIKSGSDERNINKRKNIYVIEVSTGKYNKTKLFWRFVFYIIHMHIKGLFTVEKNAKVFKFQNSL